MAANEHFAKECVAEVRDDMGARLLDLQPLVQNVY